MMSVTGFNRRGAEGSSLSASHGPHTDAEVLAMELKKSSLRFTSHAPFGMTSRVLDDQ